MFLNLKGLRSYRNLPFKSNLRDNKMGGSGLVLDVLLHFICMYV